MERENDAPGEFEQLAGRLADEGKTPMFVAVDGMPAGIIGVAVFLLTNRAGSYTLPRLL